MSDYSSCNPVLLESALKKLPVAVGVILYLAYGASLIRVPAVIRGFARTGLFQISDSDESAERNTNQSFMHKVS